MKATWAENEAAIPTVPERLELVVAIGNWRMYSQRLRSAAVALEAADTPWPPDGKFYRERPRDGSFAWKRNLFRPGAGVGPLQRPLDHRQMVLTVEHVAVDEIGRRAEDRAADRLFGVLLVDGRDLR